MKTALLFLYTETSLHAGSGGGLAAVDLPIQRERTTDFPVVQGSGVKGALRSACGPSNETNAVFGPETDNAKDHAGALSVGDARIVLFPVRSLAGVFAYVTCPQVLSRLGRDAAIAGLVQPGSLNVPDLAGNSCLTGKNKVDVLVNASVVLEEFTFSAMQNSFVDELATWLSNNALPNGEEYKYWRDKLARSLVILPDDAFRDFVKNSTEVVTRVRLQTDTKTVAQGALWTQEALPSDTLLASAITARRLRLPADSKRPTGFSDSNPDTLLQWVSGTLPGRFQLGGDETTGQGCVGARWLWQ